MQRSCDTMVALYNATKNGQTVFAKNSDRAANECQPLELHPRQEHAAGTSTGCQFVTVPDVSVTYRHVGSRPWWCWGYEHGFNEHQVVIGNEGLRSKLTYDQPKLIGMELVRLGLERGRTAADAVDVMTGLITLYGQGVFEGAPREGSYDNGFLVADPKEAYAIETAGHHWAVKRVEKTLGISNVHALHTDWDRLSPDAEAFAREQGWWQAVEGKLDFAAAFTHPDFGTNGIASGARRRFRSCTVLSQRVGNIDARTMMALLSDHSNGAEPGEPFQTAIPGGGGICFHYVVQEGKEAGGNTAASLVADLCGDGSRLPIYWCSFYSPCLGVFLPLFIEGNLPAVLSVGGEKPSDQSVWWQFHRFSRLVRSQPEKHIPYARQQWGALQDRFFASAEPLACEGRRLYENGQADAASRLLSDYMQANVEEMLTLLKQMSGEFAS